MLCCAAEIWSRNRTAAEKKRGPKGQLRAAPSALGDVDARRVAPRFAGACVAGPGAATTKSLVCRVYAAVVV